MLAPLKAVAHRLVAASISPSLADGVAEFLPLLGQSIRAQFCPKRLVVNGPKPCEQLVLGTLMLLLHQMRHALMRNEAQKQAARSWLQQRTAAATCANRGRLRSQGGGDRLPVAHTNPQEATDGGLSDAAVDPLSITSGF